MSSPQVLDEGMSSDHDAGGPVPFEAPHRSKSCLEPPVVGFDPIVGVLGRVVQCSRQEVGNATRTSAWARSVVTSAG